MKSDRSGTENMASLGVIAQVPGERPCYVPLCKEMFSGSHEDALDLIRDAISVVFGFEEDEDENDLRLLYRGKALDDQKSVFTFTQALTAGMPCTVRVLFSLLGGKGGFGNLLKKQMSQGKKTTNFDAMRDLSGRRLRHSKAVDRIKDWMEKKKRDDDLCNLIVGEGPDLPKVPEKWENLDPEYLQRLKRTAADRAGVVGQGMKLAFDELEEAAPAKKMRAGDSNGASSSLSLPAGASIAAAASSSAAAGSAGTSSADLDFLNALGMLSGSEEEGSQDADEAPASTPASSSSAAAASSSSSSSRALPSSSSAAAAAADGEEDDDEADAAADEVEDHDSAAAKAALAEKDRSAALPSYLKAWNKPEKAVAPAAAAPAAVASTGKVVGPAELGRFFFAEDLARNVSPDDVKLSLSHFGMKCGGKPEERAARLFLLKTTPVDKLPKAVLAQKK